MTTETAPLSSIELDIPPGWWIATLYTPPRSYPRQRERWFEGDDPELLPRPYSRVQLIGRGPVDYRPYFFSSGEMRVGKDAFAANHMIYAAPNPFVVLIEDGEAVSGVPDPDMLELHARIPQRFNGSRLRERFGKVPGPIIKSVRKRGPSGRHRWCRLDLVAKALNRDASILWRKYQDFTDVRLSVIATRNHELIAHTDVPRQERPEHLHTSTSDLWLEKDSEVPDTDDPIWIPVWFARIMITLEAVNWPGTAFFRP